MRINQQPAFILHTRPYSETSLLLDVFTHEHGRLMLLAKGARRRKSNRRGMLLQFRPLLMGWSGKGQLPVLTGVEQIARVDELSGSARSGAYYMNELLLKLLHRHDPHEALFTCYANTLASLGNEDSIHQSLRLFEKSLLDEIGFGLILDHDSDTGEAIEPEADYVYHFDKGPVRCADDATDVQPVKTIRGSTLLALYRNQLDNKNASQQVHWITANALRNPLNNRELKTRRVVREMVEFRKQSLSMFQQN
ncbi:MAG: DNA repair protein RecO [Pseudomonadota bacterium]